VTVTNAIFLVHLFKNHKEEICILNKVTYLYDWRVA